MSDTNEKHEMLMNAFEKSFLQKSNEIFSNHTWIDTVSFEDFVEAVAYAGHFLLCVKGHQTWNRSIVRQPHNWAIPIYTRGMSVSINDKILSDTLYPSIYKSLQFDNQIRDCKEREFIAEHMRSAILNRIGKEKLIDRIIKRPFVIKSQATLDKVSTEYTDAMNYYMKRLEYILGFSNEPPLPGIQDDSKWFEDMILAFGCEMESDFGETAVTMECSFDAYEILTFEDGDFEEALDDAVKNPENYAEEWTKNHQGSYRRMCKSAGKKNTDDRLKNDEKEIFETLNAWKELSDLHKTDKQEFYLELEKKRHPYDKNFLQPVYDTEDILNEKLKRALIEEMLCLAA